MLITILQLKKKDKMLYVPFSLFNMKILHALSLAPGNAPFQEQNHAKSLQPARCFFPRTTTPKLLIQIANGNLDLLNSVRGEILIGLYFAGKVFEESFLALPTMGTILLGMYFFENYSVNRDISHHFFNFPNHMMSMQAKQHKNYKFKTG